MSVNHTDRYEGVVKAALKEAALGEAFGFAVSFGYWPLKDLAGNDLGMGAGWFIFVSIRGGGIGEPDEGNGFPVPGLLPPDELVRNVAASLLNKCRDDRDKKKNDSLAQARAAYARSMETRSA